MGLSANWTVDPNAPITVESLLQRLSEMCDGAHKSDGVGFNKPDSGQGNLLAVATMNGMAFCEDDAEQALSYLRKYQRQLGGKAFMDEFLSAPVFEQDIAQSGGTERAQRRYARRTGDVVSFQFPYDPDMIGAIKGALNGAGERPQWDRDAKRWTIRMVAGNVDLIRQFMADHGFMVIGSLEAFWAAPDAPAASTPKDVPNAAPAPSENPRKVFHREGATLAAITFPYDPAMVAAVKALPRLRDRNGVWYPKWDGAGKRWFYPAIEKDDALSALLAFANANSFDVPAHLSGKADAIADEHKAIADAQARMGYQIGVDGDGITVAVANAPQALVDVLADMNG